MKSAPRKAFSLNVGSCSIHYYSNPYTDLEQAGDLPEQITARAKAIAQAAKVSQQTLYKHLNLWHPEHQEGVIAQLVSLIAPK